MNIANTRRQSGVALITVLMILAIMVTVAATMTGRLTLGLKRTEGLIFSQKVYWYGQAAADFGRMILNEDFSNSTVISLDQIWATPDMVFPLDNGNLGGQFKDMRSCFNVNAIALKNQGGTPALPVTQFKDLLEGLGVENYRADMIAESTRDWIDENDISDASQGAEDSFYEGRAVAHLAANNLMVDISELRAVQGVGQKVYDKIAPYLCAIPSTQQKINVNTVSVEHPEILYALFKKNHNLTIADFKELLQNRPVSGWNSTGDFLASNLLKGRTVSDDLKKQLSVSSDFFQLNGIVEFEERLLAVQLLFKIKSKKAQMIRYQSGGLK